METQILQERHNVYAINQALGWMIVIFNKKMVKTWINDKKGHFISKLRAHRSNLDKPLDNHFSQVNIDCLKNAIDDFLIINETTGFKRLLLGWLITNRGRKIEKKAIILLRN